MFVTLKTGTEWKQVFVQDPRYLVIKMVITENESFTSENPFISWSYRLSKCSLFHAISYCVRVGTSDNDGQIKIDWLSKERKEGRGGWWAERKKSEGLTSLLFCHIDKSNDGDSQWT